MRVGLVIYYRVSPGTKSDVVARKMLGSNWRSGQYSVTPLTQLTQLKHRTFKIAEKNNR
jgi:hypothetical protein